MRWPPAHGGAVVFSRVITKTEKETVKDAEGNPVKDAEGNPETKTTTTTTGGLYAVKGGRLNQLTEDPTDTEPSFSPDGRAIVFSRDGDVFTVRADGSGLRRLTSGADAGHGAERLAERQDRRLRAARLRRGPRRPLHGGRQRRRPPGR